MGDTMGAGIVIGILGVFLIMVVVVMVMVMVTGTMEGVITAFMHTGIITDGQIQLKGATTYIMEDTTTILVFR